MQSLSALQDKAVLSFRDWYGEHAFRMDSIDQSNLLGSTPYFYLAGYAGTGKSTILPYIIESTGLPLEKVAFCAPTGKAAKVMTKKMGEAGMDAVARTIHSYIYRPRIEKPEVLEREIQAKQSELTARLAEEKNAGPSPSLSDAISKVKTTIEQLNRDLDKAYKRREGPSFQFNPESAIKEARLIVVDEGSMVGTEIADDLKTFNIPLLVIGDPGQLPPINDEPGFMNRDPDFFLNEIHRQAADNPIIALATMVREGKVLRPGKMGSEVDIILAQNDNATFDMSREAQVIVGTNRKRWRITRKLREAMGYTSEGPSAGEPIIICKNSRSIPTLVNGSFVRAENTVKDLVAGDAYFDLEISDETGTMRTIRVVQSIFEEGIAGDKKGITVSPKEDWIARRDYEQADWGHAITCHKSQGSQWGDVIVHDESGVFREHSTNWLYTAVTRAAERLTVII